MPPGDEPVELQVLHDRAGMALAHAREQVRHQPDARLRQVADRLAEVRRPHPDVRVGDQDHVVLAKPVHRGQVLDLRIQPERRRADDELGVVVGKLGQQLLHHGDRRIVLVGHAEEQLIGGIIEPEEAPQVLLELLVQALERLEDRDRRRVSGLDQRLPRFLRVTQPRAAIESSVEATATMATRPSSRLTFSGEGMLRSTFPSLGESELRTRKTQSRPRSRLGDDHDSGHHGRSGFIRSSIGPWQQGQICGYRTLIVQILQ